MDPLISADQLKSVMHDFHMHLIGVLDLKPSTATLYKSAVSNCIKKQMEMRLDNTEALTAYRDDLAINSPAYGSIFPSAWRQFVAYMQETRGMDVANFTDAEDVTDPPPAAEVYVLWFAFQNQPLNRVVALTWHQFKRDVRGNLHLYVQHPTKNFNMTYDIEESREPAVKKIMEWGHGTTQIKDPGALVFPARPGASKPMSRQMFTKVLELGKPLYRAEEHRPLTREERARRPEVRPGYERAYAEELLAHRNDELDWTKVFPRKTPPPGIDDATKQQLYNEWCQLAPAGTLDRMYLDTHECKIASLTFIQIMLGMHDSRARWRRLCWEMNEPNDFGPPPHSLSKINDPVSSWYAMRAADEAAFATLRSAPPASFNPELFAKRKAEIEASGGRVLADGRTVTWDEDIIKAIDSGVEVTAEMATRWPSLGQ